MPSDRAKAKAKGKAAAVVRTTKAATAAAPPPAEGGPPPPPPPPPLDDGAARLAFPASLTPRQRALLHALAEACGLAHASAGDGAARHIVLGSGPDVDVAADFAAAAAAGGGGGDAPAGGAAAAPSDGAVAAALSRAFGAAAGEAYLARQRLPPPQPPQRQQPQQKPNGAAAAARKVPPPPLPSTMGNGGGGGGYASVEQFVATMGRLLELERQAEVDAASDAAALRSDAAAQARGRALLNLRVEDAEGGLLGRTLLTLVPNKGFGCVPPPQLPAHKFGPHDVVALRPMAGGGGGGASGPPPLATGLVYRVRDTAIVVAVDEPPEEGLEQPLRLEKLANEVTYRRLQETLKTLAAPGGGGGAAANACVNGGGGQALPGLALLDVMFGGREPRFAPSPLAAAAAASSAPPRPAFNARLDASQAAAVALALRAQDVALIHGPPGTGKTTAVVELILQEAARGGRVLAAAASNVAVDNLVERLASASPKLKLVRLGHPARLLPQVLDRSLEAQVLRSDNSALARDAKKERADLSRQLLKLEPWKRAERRKLRLELRDLAKVERDRQARAVKEVVDGARVVCCTLSGAAHPQLDGQAFDVAVIDEAAQALEPACWAALLKARRAVLAGDHLQLPPTVLSDEAARAGLGRTLFERLQGSLSPGASQMLTVQYRMHADIMQWSSDEMYGGALEAHESVAGHTVADLPGAAGSAAAAGLRPLLLIDTAGCDGCEEAQEEDGDSRLNRGEAAAALAHVRRLLALGLRPCDVGIITPYAAQVALLKELRPERLAAAGLEVATVDGFQGREKEAIVISAVRSNARGEVGFLADARRMNVAVTRARRHCALVADSETLRADAFLGRLVDYLEARGDYESAAEVLETHGGGGGD